MSQQQTTETGINIANYTADRDARLVSITKPVKQSGNYVWMRTTHTLQVINGVPTAVEGAPELRNINRQSVADFAAALDAEEQRLHAMRAQLAAITADMDALDAQA